jgi:hypothetical protein
MSVYLGGRGSAGHLVSAATLLLRTSVVASSAAALAALALRLGGARAVRLLFCKSYLQLVKGFGTSAERKALARSWLSRLEVPLDASLADVAELHRLPCSFFLFCAESQVPKLYHGSAEANIALVDLAAALCSLAPVQLEDGCLLMDAELLLPFEVLAALVRPAPLFVVGPMEAAPRRSALALSFGDRMLARHATSLPVFRTRSCSAMEALILPAAEVAVAPSADAAATIFCFFLACILRVAARRLMPGPQTPAPSQSPLPSLRAAEAPPLPGS